MAKFEDSQTQVTKFLDVGDSVSTLLGSRISLGLGLPSNNVT